MRYMLLIYSDAEALQKMNKAEEGAFMQGYYDFTKEVQQRGVLVSGEPLQPVTSATTVRVRNGKILTTDGPFAETKEFLAGYYLLNCKDLDEAREFAAKIPDASIGSIEIRPIMEVNMPA